MQWHQVDHMQTICTPLQPDNHTNTSSLIFLQAKPDALPDIQPTLKAIFYKCIIRLPSAMFTSYNWVTTQANTQADVKVR